MRFSTIFRKVIVILFWIGLWGVAAYLIDKPLLLPTPAIVLLRIFELITTSDFWIITTLSLSRITLGIICAITLGCIFALITANNGILSDLLSPLQTITKVTPVASFILLVLIWINRNTVPAIISALMVLPVVWNNMSEGLRNIDKSLLEMAHVYKLSITTKFKRILLPSVLPYFLSAIRTSIGIGWKAGIAAEVLTVPSLSIGKMIAESKMYMETVDLFAWTIVVIIISLSIELLVVRLIKRYSKNYFNKVDGNDLIK